MAGRLLVEVMTPKASSNLPSATLAMNSGICTFTGQPFTHLGFLQFRQRLASSMAISSV